MNPNSYNIDSCHSRTSEIDWHDFWWQCRCTKSPKKVYQTKHLQAKWKFKAQRKWGRTYLLIGNHHNDDITSKKEKNLRLVPLQIEVKTMTMILASLSWNLYKQMRLMKAVAFYIAQKYNYSCFEWRTQTTMFP